MKSSLIMIHHVPFFLTSIFFKVVVGWLLFHFHHLFLVIENLYSESQNVLQNFEEEHEILKGQWSYQKGMGEGEFYGGGRGGGVG